MFNFFSTWKQCKYFTYLEAVTKLHTVSLLTKSILKLTQKSTCSSFFNYCLLFWIDDECFLVRKIKDVLELLLTSFLTLYLSYVLWKQINEDYSSSLQQNIFHFSINWLCLEWNYIKVKMNLWPTLSIMYHIA